MIAYLITSGVIFGLLAAAHLLRIALEGGHAARDPWFVLMTIAAAAMCAWAFGLLRSAKRS